MFCYKLVLVARRIYFFPKTEQEFTKIGTSDFFRTPIFQIRFLRKIGTTHLKPCFRRYFITGGTLIPFSHFIACLPPQNASWHPALIYISSTLAIPSTFRLYNAHETFRPLSIYSYRPRYDVLKFCPWVSTTIVSNILRAHPLILSPFLAPKITWDMQTITEVNSSPVFRLSTSLAASVTLKASERIPIFPAYCFYPFPTWEIFQWLPETFLEPSGKAISYSCHLFPLFSNKAGKPSALSQPLSTIFQNLKKSRPPFNPFFQSLRKSHNPIP